MMKTEVERLVSKAPGVKAIRIAEAVSKVKVLITFNWYVPKYIRRQVLSFLAEVFTYLKPAGIVYIFVEDE